MTTSTYNPQLFKMSIERFVTADTHVSLLPVDYGVSTVKVVLPGSSDRSMFITKRAHSYSVELWHQGEEVLHKEFVGQSCFDDLAKFLSFVN